MDEIKESLDNLRDTILNSDAFQRYDKIRTEVKLYPEKEKRLYELRRKNYVLQNSKEKVDMYMEVSRLEQEYSDVYKDPLLNEYLAAEVAVCRIIQQVNREIIESLEFEAVLF